MARPPERLLWAHHPLWSSDGFGDPSFTQIQHPRQPGVSSGKAPWLGGYRLWVGMQGTVNPVWAQHQDPGGQSLVVPCPSLLLARQDADAGYPRVALTLQQQQGQLSSACSSCLFVLVSGQESHGWPGLSCQRYMELQPTWDQSFKPKQRK